MPSSPCGSVPTPEQPRTGTVPRIAAGHAARLGPPHRAAGAVTVLIACGLAWAATADGVRPRQWHSATDLSIAAGHGGGANGPVRSPPAEFADAEAAEDEIDPRDASSRPSQPPVACPGTGSPPPGCGPAGRAMSAAVLAANRADLSRLCRLLL